MIIFYFILFVVYMSISYIVAKKFEVIAFQKGYDESVHSFAMCFWLGVAGYLYVIALPDLTVNHQVNYSNLTQVDLDTQTNEQVDNTIPNSNEEVSSQQAMYDNLVKKAEKFKDPFYAREYRIRVYRSIVKDMAILASQNYKDSANKLEEYNTYLDQLIRKLVK